ncbi:MAG: hypothetical protein U0271_31360 [Polyangiaceae bacterium]
MEHALRMVERFVGPGVPTLLPYALADAVAVLLAHGDDGEALAARMSAPELSLFVRAVVAYVRGGPMVVTRWPLVAPRELDRASLEAELARGSALDSDTQGELLTALALHDPERAHRLYVSDIAWPSRGAITDAFGVMAPWIVRTRGAQHLVDWALGMRYHVAASEWLAAAARVGALAPEELEPVALELAGRIETWLDPFSWSLSLAPLASLAAEIGSVAVIDALCHRYLPRGERLADAMTGGLTRFAQTDAARARRFIDALEASAPFAESFDPPDDLCPAPWEAIAPAWLEVMIDPSRAELREASFDLLRLASGTTLPSEVWRVTCRSGRRA